MSVADKIASLKASLPSGVTLVAVSKTYPPSAIMEAYEAGQRVFGENRPQELAAKQAELPGDIEAAFKAAGRALRQAVAVDPALGGAVPSTKGVL